MTNYNKRLYEILFNLYVTEFEQNLLKALEEKK